MLKMNLFFIFLLTCISTSYADSGRYRLVWRDDPSTTIVIGWENQSGANHRVYYDVVDHGADTSAYAYMHYPDHSNNVKGMENTFARITGLTPGTKYYFVVADDSYISNRMWFKTISNDPTERLSFIIGGDSRSNQAERQLSNKMVAKLRPHGVIFGGDYVSDGTDDEWRVWFDDWQLTIASDGKITPLVATQGNHELIWTNFPDGNDVVDELFDAPSDKYFTLSFGGSLLRLYSLDSEYPVSSSYGSQTTWFENDLASNAASYSWLVAQYHSPVRPHNSDKLEGDKQYDEWVPLFDQYSFAFVHENDAHLTKRTWPIRKSSEPGSDEGFIRDDFNGTVYIGEGGWGAPLRDVDDNKSWTRDSEKIYQVNWVFIDQDTIEIRTVKTENVDSIDSVTDYDVFTPPANLDIWNPSNGEVIIIQHFTTPDCNILSPVDGTHYSSPQTITIEADANDVNGIAQVEFFVDDVSVGTDSTAPYTTDWTIPNDGFFYLTAKSTNIQGVHSVASPVVQVGCGFQGNTIIVQTNDDAEENLDNGAVDLTSSDIELICETGLYGSANTYDQAVGIRFETVNIPQGAIISSATIQFETDEADYNDNPCNLNIQAEDIDDAPAFSDNDGNITNRTLTTASMSWSPSDWNTVGEAGADQQTQDISSVIQEITDRSGWTNNNDIAIIITGEGRRTAEPDNAILTVDYSVNVEPDVEIINPVDAQVYSSLATLNIDADASDFDGSIANVEFFYNGNSIGIDNTSPYSVNWSIPDYNTYELSAIATDDLGAQTVSEIVSIYVTTPPEVELTKPLNDTTIYGLSTFTIEASATDSIGTVAFVEFYIDGSIVGTDSTAPYSCDWLPSYYNSFLVNAMATDNNGVTSNSTSNLINLEISEKLDETSDMKDIKIYPNPVNDLLNIEFGNFYKSTRPLIVMYHIDSEKYMQRHVKIGRHNKIIIDMSQFVSGVYIIQIAGKESIVSKRIIKN
ncbi:MAG: Ig-like domain-containing protein [Bacteroidota bacterium]|nr:Ig-like domain-containing protein [Bacteroidota bacterium]